MKNLIEESLNLEVDFSEAFKGNPLKKLKDENL